MSTEYSPPKEDHPLERLVDGVVECWEHAMSTSQQTFEGTYRSDDTLGALAQCSAKAAELGVAAFVYWVDMLRPPSRYLKANPQTVSTTVPLHPSMWPRKVDLYTDGLRGIGWEYNYKIAPGDVTVQRTVINPGNRDAVTVTVSFAQVTDFERGRTIVYEGEIRARGIPGPATDTFRIPKPAQ